MNTSLSKTISNVLQQARRDLKIAGIISYNLDAELLLAHILGKKRVYLMTYPEKILSIEQYNHFQEVLQLRVTRKPLSQIIGKREFWSLEFKISEDVLDPRPDSETLIAAVIRQFPDKKSKLQILDLGTGSGCLLLTLLHEYKNAYGIGLDINKKSLLIAQKNADSLLLSDRSEFMLSNWVEILDNTQDRNNFDIIISNPPYIETDDIVNLMPEVANYEPIIALDGGRDGLNCYKQIIPLLPNFLKAKGKLFFEIGMGQEQDISAILKQHSFTNIQYHHDLSNIVRVLECSL